MHNIYDNNENDNVGDCPRPHQDRLMIDTLMNGMDNLYSYYTVSSPSSVARIDCRVLVMDRLSDFDFYLWSLL